MTDHTSFNPKALDLYIYTAQHRYSIYRRRENGEKRPWTDNPILGKYHFCNVFRVHDKCSQWMLDNIITPKTNDPALIEYVILYRLLSTYPLYEEIKEAVNLFDLNAVQNFLRGRFAKGPMLNGCFIRNSIIRGHGSVQVYMTPFYIIKEIRAEGHYREALAEQSFEALTGYLKTFSATSSFMAHQYCCDMEYSKQFNPTDKYTYASMGPGSMQGMNLLLGRPRMQAMKQSEWLLYARDLWFELRHAIPEEDVAMQDVQNWLCEFQKYVKYRNMESGGAKVKARIYK